MWQWFLIYTVLGGLAYALIYYLVLSQKSGYKYPTGTTEKRYTTPSPSSEKAKIEAADLQAVGTYRGNGRATRSFDGTTFTHTVQANVGEPAKGKFYEGWLVKKKPTLTFFSTGKMEKQGNVYVLTYTASENYPDHQDVVITEESEAFGLDGKPEDHVLEGTFPL